MVREGKGGGSYRRRLLLQRRLENSNEGRFVTLLQYSTRCQTATCLYLWNLRRLANHNLSSPTALILPVTLRHLVLTRIPLLDQNIDLPLHLVVQLPTSILFLLHHPLLLHLASILTLVVENLPLFLDPLACQRTNSSSIRVQTLPPLLSTIPLPLQTHSAIRPCLCSDLSSTCSPSSSSPRSAA